MACDERAYKVGLRGVGKLLLGRVSQSRVCKAVSKGKRSRGSGGA